MKLRGGLGNQLFQIVGSFYFASQLKRPLLLDDQDIFRHPDKSRRTWSKHYDWSKVLKGYPIRWKSKREILLDRINIKYNSIQQVSTIQISENSLPNVTTIDDDTTITGYFLDKRYFLQSDINIEREDFKPHINKKLFMLTQEVGGQPDALIMHIRLDDFLASRSASRVPWKYYENAINAMVGSGVKRIYLFSDDLIIARAFVEEKIRKHSRIEIITPEEVQVFNPIELLWILSCAKNFISSNSTLSWWACALNPTGFNITPFGEALRLENWHTVQQ
jgi:hypothetical protein